MAWKGARVAGIAVSITVALWLIYFTGHRALRQPIPEPSAPPPRYESWGIRDLDEVIEVSSARIRPIFQGSSLPIKQETNLTLPFTNVNLTQSVPDIHTETATIVAPVHYAPDASHLLIGLATKTNRLRDSLPWFTHWASGTGVKFVALVAPPHPGDPSRDEIQELYASHDVSITLIEDSQEWYEAYVSLLIVLHDHATPQTKWVCTMDDDTYFFSMRRVLAMLNRYDADEPYYVGGVSENKETLDRLGYAAYGGGGIFFSMALIRELRPYVQDHCINLPEAAGDLRIGHCITTYTTTKLTWEHYLFQMDVHGDVTGFYEAARTRPLSTHHWNSWHHHDMVKVGAVGSVCGNECVLQKYVTADGWTMTNGFSIVKYSYSEEEASQYIEGAMEHTWADTIWVIPTSWNYTLAPLKPRDPGKIQYVIEKVDEDEDTMTIYYVRRRNGVGIGIVRMTWEKVSM